MNNIELVEQELAAAKAKHPEFCDLMTYCAHFSPKRWAALVASWHVTLTEEARLGRLSAQSILTVELFEALEQHSLGNYQAARTEWAQVAAVAIRAMEMCEREAAK